MLLTYGDSADIPTKINIFYNQAYEALVPATRCAKSGLSKRATHEIGHSGLCEGFAVFSLLTYEKRLFQFFTLGRDQVLDDLQEDFGHRVLTPSIIYWTAFSPFVCS